ncbi:unnamed protein product, partial [Iphiclides podalirius]
MFAHCYIYRDPIKGSGDDSALSVNPQRETSALQSGILICERELHGAVFRVIASVIPQLATSPTSLRSGGAHPLPAYQLLFSNSANARHLSNVDWTGLLELNRNYAPSNKA